MNYKISLLTVATISAVVLFFASSGNVKKPDQAIDLPAASPIIVSQPAPLIDVTAKPVMNPAKPIAKSVQTSPAASASMTMAPSKASFGEQKTIAQPAEPALVAAMLEAPVTNSVSPPVRATQNVSSVEPKPATLSAPIIEVVTVHQPVQPQIIISAPATPTPATAANPPDFAIYTELAANRKSTSAGLGIIYGNLIGADLYTTNTHNNYNPAIGAGLQAYANKNLLSFLPDYMGAFADLGVLYHTRPGSVAVADSAGHLAYRPSGSEWLVNYGGGIHVQIPVSAAVLKNAVVNLGYGSAKGATVGLGITW